MDATTAIGDRSLRLPYAWTAILLAIGGCFLLLLNGQVFTNGLIFLGCAIASCIIWLRFVIRSWQSSRNRIALFVLFLHALVIIVFAVGIPARYAWQQRFNKRVYDIQRRVIDSPNQR